MSQQSPSLHSNEQNLSKSLGILVERLAQRNHDQWYKDRLEAGWSFDEQHDEAQKKSPFMLPYDELPQNKKTSILQGAEDTLNTILDEGYCILQSEEQTDLSSDLHSLKKELECEESATIDSKVLLWRNRNQQLWQKHPSLYLQAGKGMLSSGEPLLAYDILSEGVETMGGLTMLDEVEGETRSLLILLLQQKALALAQSGASGEANSILLSLQKAGLTDSETIGILGRTWKDMAMEIENILERKRCLEAAFFCYNTTYEAEYNAGNFESAYYTGINAASVSLLAGNIEQSKKIAEQVRKICEDILQYKANRNEPISFWLYASLGEASLLQGDIAKAEEFYTLAAEGCSKDIRALGSMRKQARLILDAAGQDEKLLDHCFSVPSVILFSGHIIDQPTRSNKRFPIENEELVRSRIAKWLDEQNGQIGFSSAACGSDIIFLEEMLKREGEINIVLPFEKEPFIETSVNVVQDGNWVERFENVLNKATEIKILSQYNEITLDDDLLFTNLYMYGTAQVRAERAGTDLKTLLVWDRSKAQSLAGTAALADLIHEKGGFFDIVSPLEKEVSEVIESDDGLTIGDDSGSTTSVTVGKRKAIHHSFLPLLIADVKGYSRLGKKEKLLFASNFMGEMAAVLDPFTDRILGRKTQGDSLFLVFKDIKACVESAKALRVRTANIDWTTFGLSSQLVMRISLDAGPCYSYNDPITMQLDFCGDYIVRAARLEPVTPPGNVYASETFVAVAKALGVKNVKFDYAGQVELPKGYGRMQAFHLK